MTVWGIRFQILPIWTHLRLARGNNNCEIGKEPSKLCLVYSYLKPKLFVFDKINYILRRYLSIDMQVNQRVSLFSFDIWAYFSYFYHIDDHDIFLLSSVLNSHVVFVCLIFTLSNFHFILRGGLYCVLVAVTLLLVHIHYCLPIGLRSVCTDESTRLWVKVRIWETTCNSLKVCANQLRTNIMWIQFRMK